MAKGGGGQGRCMGCGEMFSGERSFEMHRSGGYGEPIYKKGTIVGYTPPTRHCLSVSELLAKGMAQNPYGTWTTGQKMDSSVIALRRKGQIIDEDPEEEESEEEETADVT